MYAGPVSWVSELEPLAVNVNTTDATTGATALLNNYCYCPLSVSDSCRRSPPALTTPLLPRVFKGEGACQLTSDDSHTTTVTVPQSLTLFRRLACVLVSCSWLVWLFRLNGLPCPRTHPPRLLGYYHTKHTRKAPRVARTVDCTTYTSADFGSGNLRLCSESRGDAGSVRPIRGWPIATFD